MQLREFLWPALAGFAALIVSIVLFAVFLAPISPSMLVVDLVDLVRELG